MRLQIFWLLGLLLALVVSSTAQTGTIRGNVFDKDTGEPIIFANIVLEGTTLGANTDFDGFFSLTNVPVGKQTVMVTYLGYDTAKVEITLKENAVVYQRFLLEESGIVLGVVDVSASRTEARNEVQISKITVTPSQIKALPSTGGEADIAQYLPVLPGVIYSGDQGGQLYIRGGSPIQNKVLLDGMTIYNPFHSIGFFSVFETETVRNIDVLTGGFNAEYGGRISAIVDIKTREGNKKRFGGLVSASPFQAKALFEGPIKAFNEEKGGGSTSFILTGKHSYIDRTSETLYDYATDSLGLPYRYTDFYGKITSVTGNGSKINIFGFNFDDQVNFAGVADLGWTSNGVGANMTIIPPGSNTIIGANITYSKYEVELDEADGRPRQSGINGFNAILDFTYFGNNSEFKYGFELNGFQTDFQFENFLGNRIQQVENTTEIHAFFKDKHKFNRLIIEPSIRFIYYASLNETSFEPRFGLKYNATDNLRFKMAGGVYSQNLISSVNERDVVNLFVGFLSGPEETIFTPDGSERANTRLQKAMHLVGGMELDIGRYTQINVEPYFKDFTQLISLNRNKRSEADPNYMTESGEAYGLDLSFKYQKNNWYVWSTYSLGRVTRDDGEQIYPTVFDRRHNVNLLLTYTFGKDREWEAAARWNYGSGFPFTLTQGFYGWFNFLDGINTDYLSGNPDLGIIFDEERNAGRLPDYHRMDISLKRTFDFDEHRTLEITASVTNAYDRENIFFFDRVRYDRVNQLPILPSLGASMKF